MHELLLRELGLLSPCCCRSTTAHHVWVSTPRKEGEAAPVSCFIHEIHIKANAAANGFCGEEQKLAGRLPTSREQLRQTVLFVMIILRLCLTDGFGGFWAQGFPLWEPKPAAGPEPQPLSVQEADGIVQVEVCTFLETTVVCLWFVTGRCGGVMAYPDSCQLERSGICWDAI